MNAQAQEASEPTAKTADNVAETDELTGDGRGDRIGEQVDASQEAASTPVAANLDVPSQAPASSPTWAPRQWYGRMLVDRDGKHLGKLQDVYVDVETDEPKFATVKEGLWPGRHLTFVPLTAITIGPDNLRVDPEELHVDTTAEQVSSGPDLAFHGDELSVEDESALYHHFQQNYLPLTTTSGRRLARR